jgi:hypothetical protein
MSVLNRVEKLEVALLQLKRELDDRTSMLADKTVGLEQATASIGKTLAALSDELTSTKALDSKAVLNRLREAEDNNARRQINSMLSSGYLEQSNTVEQDSLVVVAHAISLPDGTSDTTSSFTIVSMLSGAADPKLKELLLGKNAGDVFKGEEDETGYEEFTIMHVFKLASKTVEATDAP